MKMVEPRSANLRFYCVLAFLAVNVGVVICESWIISHPNSTVICLPGNTSFNVSLVGGINSGVFTSLDRTTSMAVCTRRACEKREGHLAFLIEDSCFLVTCFTEEYCKTKPQENAPNILSVAVTPYRWFDAAPVFLNLPKTIKAHENSEGKGSLLVIRAKAESRRSENASVNFFITGGDVNNAFRLERRDDVSATLVVAVSLDREENPQYNLEITAVNVEEGKRSKSMLAVEVLDSNDNPPRFPKHNYTTTIMSNISIGAEIFRVKAEDDDPNDSQLIRYQLANHNYVFQILSESGRVLVRNKIRVDRLRRFNLIVVALDGVHRTVKTLMVNVIPVNEYRPYFERLEYRVKVSEAVTIGTSVIKLSARDNDYGVLGALNFSIVSGNSQYFNIDSEGIIRTSKYFINSKDRNFTLAVSVRDRGSPPKYSMEYATVKIFVEHVQNHKVKFDLRRYYVTLLESTPIGSKVVTVRAVSGIGKRKLDIAKAERKLKKRSKKIFYTVSQQDGDGVFHVGRHSGDVKIRKRLDYEKRTQYRLVITARDSEKRGKGRKSGSDKKTYPEEWVVDSTVVIVQLLDVNDNAPVFVPSEYQKIVDEKTAVGTSILKVNATDPDSSTNSKVKFLITGGNVNNTFTMENTGVLKLRNRLEGQKNSIYNLSITARDFGSPPLQSLRPAFVYIKVKGRGSDLPTQRPKFPIVISTATVAENCAIGTTVLQVSARNDVTGEADSMNYWLTALKGQEVQSRFAIDSKTGIIRTIGQLDYETTQRYVFYVAATDVRAMSSIDTVLVRIIVTDVNDNRPKWKDYKKEVALTKQMPTNSILTRVEAKDKDSGNNGKLEYSIVSGNTGNFLWINSWTGAITIQKSLKKENLRLINLRASVTDAGSPPLASIRQAQISVMVFCDYEAPLILVETTESSMRVRFNLKNLDTRNVAKYAIIVQEYSTDQFFNEYTAKEPITWYRTNHVLREGQNLHRYIAKLVYTTDKIARDSYIEQEVGIEKGCEKKVAKTDYCNGPLKGSLKYRFQLRAYVKNNGPFSKFLHKDSKFSDTYFTALPLAKASYKKEGKRNYDGIVYSVGVALVLVIVLAFLRGFLRLRRDKKRIHEEKKRRISFPLSNPKFEDAESPVDKIQTPGPARKMVSANSTTADKGSEYARSDEDEGSSPDSALDEGLRRLEQENRPANLQEQRLKNYFNSVDSSSCHSCDHVRIYCVQEGSSKA